MAHKMDIPIMDNYVQPVHVVQKLTSEEIDERLKFMDGVANKLRYGAKIDFDEVQFSTISNEVEMLEKYLENCDSILSSCEDQVIPEEVMVKIRDTEIEVEKRRNKWIEFIANLNIEKKLKLFKAQGFIETYGDSGTLKHWKKAETELSAATWMPDNVKQDFLAAIVEKIAHINSDYEGRVNHNIFIALILFVLRLIVGIGVCVVIYIKLWHWLAYLLGCSYVLRVIAMYQMLNDVQTERGEHHFFKVLFGSSLWI